MSTFYLRKYFLVLKKISVLILKYIYYIYFNYENMRESSIDSFLNKYASSDLHQNDEEYRSLLEGKKIELFETDPEKINLDLNKFNIVFGDSILYQIEKISGMTHCLDDLESDLITTSPELYIENSGIFEDLNTQIKELHEYSKAEKSLIHSFFKGVQDVLNITKDFKQLVSESEDKDETLNSLIEISEKELDIVGERVEIGGLQKIIYDVQQNHDTGDKIYHIGKCSETEQQCLFKNRLEFKWNNMSLGNTLISDDKVLSISEERYQEILERS